ncbi:dTDP-4-dehydrorhamnose 3,5-epimerase [Nostoc sp. CHAB 5834]|nr:dTDP-4-dehydrorhamnose 3,5-epimerase [Nostoc sp. CHAB 5834]
MPVKVLTPARFVDSRGWFSESWNRQRFENWGVAVEFVQDNQSLSTAAGTIRGLHFQRNPLAQSKLVRCIKGRIYDVAVDLRLESPTYCQWVAVELSADKGNQLFIPAGFAHGFLTLEPNSEVAYKVDAYYAPQADGGIAWDDPRLKIDWPIGKASPVLSEKDAGLPMVDQTDFYFEYDGCPLSPLNSES